MKLKCQHRDPRLVGALIIRVTAQEGRIDPTTIDHPSPPETVERTIGDLLGDGIIRVIRDRTGNRIKAHALTTLGLAWWQGRTTNAVPRYDGTTWSWWTPTAADLELDPDEGALLFEYPGPTTETPAPEEHPHPLDPED